ncbi:MAG TPA: PLD nuclease N-terminal domain-containing protein [Ruminiclostridium sp.]|nr:PLD nuclease N-terminal domain-containing protein [Ruminiclostridium sp.]
MNNMTAYLPFLIPIFIIEFGLMVAALIHIFRHKTYKIGNRLIWVIVVILFEIVGPVLYFIIGRSDD